MNHRGEEGEKDRETERRLSPVSKEKQKCGCRPLGREKLTDRKQGLMMCRDKQTRDLRAGTVSSTFPAVSLTLGLSQSVLEKCRFGE